MYSYFAIIAKTTDAIPNANILANKITKEQPIYSISLECGRLLYLHAGTDIKGFHTYTLNSDMGIIGGTLFKKTISSTGTTVPLKINNIETTNIVSSNGRHLIKHYWGRYTAFIKNNSDDTYHIIRDPTGVMPAYYYDFGDLIIFFSDFEHFLNLRLARLSINIDHVLCFLQRPFLPYSDTGLSEIHQILRGTALTIGNDGKVSSTTYWQYQDFIRRNNAIAPDDAACALRDTVTGCIHAWASEFNNIVITLSGGLDSSIVLGCLASAPNKPRITCLNRYTPNETSDERKFARKIAASKGTRLIEVLEDPLKTSSLDVDQLPIQAEPRPWRQSIGFGRSDYQVLQETHADTFFTGEGGDMIFNQSAQGIVDEYVWHHSISYGLIQQSMLYSRLKGLSFWSVLCSAILYNISPKAWDFADWARPPASVGMPEISKMTEKLQIRSEYWASCLKDIPPAKGNQIASLLLYNPLARPNGKARYIPLVQPLFSQPIIELVVKLPAYLFSWPGVDRGLARLAFKDIVPPEIIYRQSKGSPGSYYGRLFSYIIEECPTFFDFDICDDTLLRHIDHNNIALLKNLIHNTQLRKHTLFDIVSVKYWLSKIISLSNY